MKIPQVGADLFPEDRLTGRRIDGRTDGRADVAKLVVAFRNFSNAPKNDGSNVCLQRYYHLNCRYMNKNVNLTRADVIFALL